MKGGSINLIDGAHLDSTLDVTNGGSWDGFGSVAGKVTASNGAFTVSDGANLTASSGVSVKASGSLAGSGTITGSVNYTSNANSNFGGDIAGANSTLSVNTTAKLELSGVNTYRGATTVSQGTLLVSGALQNTASLAISGGATVELAASNAINNAAPITLTNATFKVDSNVTENLGDLTIGEGNSTLQLGDGGTIVKFADSSMNVWNGTLTILNWNGSSDGNGSDQIFFGDSAILTAYQLADITFKFGTADGIGFESVGATQLSNGEVVALAVPEPQTWTMLVGAMGVLLIFRRRGFCSR